MTHATFESGNIAGASSGTSGAGADSAFGRAAADADARGATATTFGAGRLVSCGGEPPHETRKTPSANAVKGSKRSMRPGDACTEGRAEQDTADLSHEVSPRRSAVTSKGPIFPKYRRAKGKETS